MWQVFSSLSLSLCPSPSPSLSSLSLSPAGRRLELRAPRAPQVSCVTPIGNGTSVSKPVEFTNGVQASQAYLPLVGVWIHVRCTVVPVATHLYFHAVHTPQAAMAHPTGRERNGGGTRATVATATTVAHTPHMRCGQGVTPASVQWLQRRQGCERRGREITHGETVCARGRCACVKACNCSGDSSVMGA